MTNTTPAPTDAEIEELLKAACEQVGHPFTLNLRPGYDHSYYFIASFMGEHVAHHAAALRG